MRNYLRGNLRQLMAIKGGDCTKMSVGSSKGHKNMVVWQSIDELDMIVQNILKKIPKKRI